MRNFLEIATNDKLIKEVPMIKGKRRVVVTFLDEPLVETDLTVEDSLLLAAGFFNLQKSLA